MFKGQPIARLRRDYETNGFKCQSFFGLSFSVIKKNAIKIFRIIYEKYKGMNEKAKTKGFTCVLDASAVRV